jgi:hypothetical protein
MNHSQCKTDTGQGRSYRYVPNHIPYINDLIFIQMKNSFSRSAIWIIQVWKRPLRVSTLAVVGNVHLLGIGVPATYTFGELREDWMKRDSGEDEVDIPDFWIEHQGITHNPITKTGRFWQFGQDNMMIGDALKNAGVHQTPTPRIDMVENDNDYIVALLEDNGVESGKVVGMWISRV